VYEVALCLNECNFMFLHFRLLDTDYFFQTWLACVSTLAKVVNTLKICILFIGKSRPVLVACIVGLEVLFLNC